MRALLLAGVAALGWAGSARAAFTDTALETSDGVVFTGAGSFNITGLRPSFFYTGGSGVVPSLSVVQGEGTGRIFDLGSGPSSFGTGLGEEATTASGDTFFISGSNRVFGVPVDYVSGATLSNAFTFAGATFTSLGITPGTYVYSFNSGANADTFTLQVGPAAGSVPEPASLALLGAGVAALVAARRRRAG